MSQRNELRKVAEQRGLSYLVKHMLAIIAWTNGYDAALKAAREWPQEPPTTGGKPALKAGEEGR